MSELQDRITEILRDNIPIRRSDCKLGVSDLVLKVTAHELAAATEQHYQPRIETVEQLDALPLGTVVRDAELNVSERLGGWDEESGEPYGLMWHTVGVAAPVIPDLPAVVLWSPGAGE